jgi:UDP-N-acetylglucosamine 2-epimerase
MFRHCREQDRSNQIIGAIKDTINKGTTLPPKSPYGDGTAAEKIVKILKEELTV